MDLGKDQHGASRYGAGVFRLAAGMAAAAGLAVLLSACANTGPGDAYSQLTRIDYGKSYIGMSKAEVLKCAGQPRSVLPASGGAETLVYRYNGAGPVPVSGGDKKKKSGLFADAPESADGDCTASLTFESGRLVRVNYAHKDARSPYEWQSEKNEQKAEKMRQEGVPTCTFSLPRCPR